MENKKYTAAQKAVMATPEFKDWEEAEKALDEAKEALERAREVVKETPEGKAYDEAKKALERSREVYRKAKDAMWATPEWMAYMKTCPGVEVRPVEKFRKTRGPLEEAWKSLFLLKESQNNMFLFEGAVRNVGWAQNAARMGLISPTEWEALEKAWEGTKARFANYGKF